MSKSSPPDVQPEAKQDDIREDVVEAYLRAHPDFFEHHLPLLATLKVPHAAGGMVSLIERQVSVLRDTNRQLERKLLDLVQVARENEDLSSRLHRLARGLLETDQLDDTIATAREQLRNDLHSTHVVIRLFGDEAKEKGDKSQVDVSMFDGLFESGRPICGRLTQAQSVYLFGEQVGEIASAVMIPLNEGRRLGILALGSPETDRFHPGMGTLFLGYLGELIGAAIKARLNTA